MLGVGEDEIERLPTDAQGRIITRNLPAIDDRTLVLAQAGNINSGAFDPFLEICRWARGANAWVHVDGAFGLWARASRSKRALTRGIELADSWAVDGHKWLNLPYDSAVYICREKQAIHDVFGADAPYLVRARKREPNNLTPELSRRARGIEFWAALKFLGRDGLESLVDQSCRHARRFAEGLAAAGFEILNDVVLNQVVASRGNEAEMTRIIERIQDDGVCWLGPTHWKGRSALRVSVSSWMTANEDVERSIASIAAAAR
jgi:glutamate/tyrosine decarboxylase-like PLP-dependent enzyme